MAKRVYIAGPISRGDLAANIRQADEAMYALMVAGLAPFNPMLSCFAGGVLAVPACSRDGETVGYAHRGANGRFRDLPHSAWLGMDLPWVEVSHALLRLPGDSSGADREVAHAEASGVPVFRSVEDVIAWANG